jgi:hypothetical protein
MSEEPKTEDEAEAEAEAHMRAMIVDLALTIERRSERNPSWSIHVANMQALGFVLAGMVSAMARTEADRQELIAEIGVNLQRDSKVMSDEEAQRFIDAGIKLRGGLQ